MILFPHCKINLGLRIIARRPDGYHNLETVFFPLPIYDMLELIRLGNDHTMPQLTLTGLPIPGEPGQNLVLKAWHLLKKDIPSLPAVDFHLHKTLPAGAGLGAGSANGAFAIRGLNSLFELQLSQQQQLAYASRLGSDAPYFIMQGPCYATGRGELLEPVALDLSGYCLLLVNPRIEISTAWAFSHITPAAPHRPVKEVIAQPVHTWKEELCNDFEKIVDTEYPAIAGIRAAMYKAGAIYAAMTGTGSSVFGIFEKKAMPSTHFPEQYFQRWVQLGS